MNWEKEIYNLGVRVKIARERAGLSQTTLANKIGKDQPTINRLEKGNGNPTFSTILDVCHGLDITLLDLLAIEI